MTLQQIKILFQNHVDGILPEADLARLKKALLELEHDDEVIKMLDSVWDEEFKSGVSEEKANAIFLSITAAKNVKKNNRKWFGIAASIAVLVSIAISFKFISSQKSKKFDTEKIESQVTIITPGQNKAVLTLSNGQTINLNEQNNGELATEAGVVVSKLSDGELRYSVNENQTEQALQFNTISTPRGGQYMVILPDGTKAWLNAHSSLRYPVYFAGKERVVEVHGEAYFEVTKNKLMPFKVIANDVEIRVIGTHFNVTAYADEPTVRTTLLEGSVDVNHNILLPGQQAQISHKSQKINISRVNTDEIVAWKNGLFIFRNEDVQSIMKKISRWYDVDVEFKDKKILDQRFGGTFSRSGELSDMLESMSLTGVIHFKTEGRRIIVMN
ncbi:FecR family protein [Pedobacter arcticus]|uniref:FecR family protein n=1 Tax=Pedobacter arcticus TaxID=752140 RepID=UPI0002FFE671|nr:FecR family protein [Pedobacter arcticus]